MCSRVWARSTRTRCRRCSSISCSSSAGKRPSRTGFFRYYWLQAPERHPYSVRDLPGFSNDWLNSDGKIISLGHLKWGLYRLYVDALLYFGNVRTAFRRLRDTPIAEIESFFTCRRFDTNAIKRRGPSLPLKPIAKDSRYLISEMACKSYADSAGADGDLRSALVQAYTAHAAAGNPSPTIRGASRKPAPGDIPSNPSPGSFGSRRK
jgi:hypothetical protein